MIRYTGVNHIAPATGNMDETVRFWKDLLEMNGRKIYPGGQRAVPREDVTKEREWGKN